MSRPVSSRPFSIDLREPRVINDKKCRTTAQFGSATESYFDNEVRRLGTDRETLVSWCRGATRALDMAIGAGHAAGVIADADVSSAIATDAAPEVAATAACEYLVAGIVADAEHPPFVDGAFDVAARRIAAHYFPDPEAFVAEIARILEPGGALTFKDSVAPKDAAPTASLNGVEMLRDPTHVELHPASRWCKWFAAADPSVRTVKTAAICLQFNPWTERTNVSSADRGGLEYRSREAPEEAKELFNTEFDGGSVVSFANPKALVRA